MQKSLFNLHQSARHGIMSKQGNRLLDWRRISAAMIAACVLFLALFTAVHAVDTGFRLAAIEMVEAAGGTTDADTQKPAALPGGCGMHCNQHEIGRAHV